MVCVWCAWYSHVTVCTKALLHHCCNSAQMSHWRQDVETNPSRATMHCLSGCMVSTPKSVVCGSPTELCNNNHIHSNIIVGFLSTFSVYYPVAMITWELKVVIAGIPMWTPCIWQWLHFNRCWQSDRALTLPVAVVDHKEHLVLLRTYVSRQACGKGRALLEALGLTRAKIAGCYYIQPQTEEDSVQSGLQVWIGGNIDATWKDLLDAMETAEIAIQPRDELKKKLYSSAGDCRWFGIIACMCVSVWLCGRGAMWTCALRTSCTCLCETV